MLDENLPDDFPFNADAIAAALAHAAMEQGDAKCVTALAVSSPCFGVTGYLDLDGYPHNCYEAYYTRLLTLYLEVPAKSFGQFYRVREYIEQKILDMLSPIISSCPYYAASRVCVIPSAKAPTDWQEQALAWLRGEGVNNQGRVRSDNIAAMEYDGLLFRSNKEINLYRALKVEGIPFAPLPVFVRGGTEYKRIEPDFVLLIGGMMAVIEVDGDNVHRESPAEADERTAMLEREGVHVIHARGSDFEKFEHAEMRLKSIMQQIRKRRASR